VRSGMDDPGYSVVYSVPVEGPATYRVLLFPDGGDTRHSHRAKVSPDGSFVVVEAHDDGGTLPPGDDTHHLVRLPISGPASAKIELKGSPLPGPLGATPAGVLSFFLTGAGEGLVYDEVSRVGNDFYFATSFVPADGPPSAYVHLADLWLGDVAAFSLSSMPTRVVFGGIGVFSVPLTGPSSELVQLNPPLPPGGGILGRIVAPDESRVIYRADVEGFGDYHVFSAPTAGPSSQTFRLSTAPVHATESNGMRLARRLVVLPDSSRVLYLGGTTVRALMSAEIRPLFSDGFESGDTSAWSAAVSN